MLTSLQVYREKWYFERHEVLQGAHPRTFLLPPCPHNFYNRITIFLFYIFFTPKIAQKHKLHQSSTLKCEIKGNVVVGMSDYNFESIPKKDHYLFKWVLTTEKACFFAPNQALGIH